VVDSNTWCAVPALLKFPWADPEYVLQLAAGCGQSTLVGNILGSGGSAGSAAGAYTRPLFSST